jgi:hypothetical protein
VDEDRDRRVAVDFYCAAEADLETSGNAAVEGAEARRRMGEWAKRRDRLNGTQVTNGTRRVGPIRNTRDIRGARHIAHSPFRRFAVSPQGSLSLDFYAYSVDQ